MSSAYYSGLINQKRSDIVNCEAEISALRSKISVQNANKTNYITKSDNFCDDVDAIKIKSDMVSSFEKRVKLSKEYARKMDESYWDSNWKRLKRECMDIETGIQNVIDKNNRELETLQNNLQRMNSDLNSYQSSYDSALAEEQAAAAAAEAAAAAALKNSANNK